MTTSLVCVVYDPHSLNIILNDLLLALNSVDTKFKDYASIILLVGNAKSIYIH